MSDEEIPEEPRDVQEELEEAWTGFGERMEEIAAENAKPLEPPVVEFDEKWRESFEGLVYLGRLEHTFKFASHEFTIKTLTVGEKMEALMLAAPYEASQMAYLKAWRSVFAAASILSVDGRPIPVAERGVGLIQQRWKWMSDTWFDPVIDAIYEKSVWLEDQMLAVLDAMGVFEPEANLAIELPKE